jgi:hypothetical protein
MVLRINMLPIITSIFVSSSKHFDPVTETQCVCMREEGICTDGNKLGYLSVMLDFQETPTVTNCTD